MARYGSNLQVDRPPRDRGRFDDDDQEPFRYGGAPQPIGRTQPRQFGVCNPPQTLEAIARAARGKKVRHDTGFSAPVHEGSVRQAKPTGRAARKKAQRELKGKKGGKR